MSDLVIIERARLAELEAVVERGMDTFIEVGIALAEIRDARLYREQFVTFEAYCRERWGFSRSRGYRLIRAAELAAMSPTGDIRSERQARALLEPTRPDVGRQTFALAFGLDPSAPLPFSVEALWRHAEVELRDARWLLVGDYLFQTALEETGADAAFVGAVMGAAATLFDERAQELAP